MPAPRVLVVLNTSAAWSRGILRGFTALAHERGWVLLHYHPTASLDWLAQEWAPAVAVLGPELQDVPVARLPACPIVSVNADRSKHGIASVCLNEARIGELALAHLAAKGLRHVTTFRFDDSPFAVTRQRAFSALATKAGLGVAEGWWERTADLPGTQEDPARLTAWLRGLPRPCGVFTCTDAWGRVVARYARVAGLRVPEDLALVGVDNDVLDCELISPPLSSVAVPWYGVGQAAASFVQRALSEKPIAGKRVVVSPIDVVARRSSDALAVDDALIARAVSFIDANANRRLTVPMVARAAGISRQRLERRFRLSLRRTVQEQIRRAHVELAKRVLATTESGLREVAKQSGFTTAALLSVAFQRELGMPPGAYRRRLQEARNETG
jgi:LacI family transcriptional regulator